MGIGNDSIAKKYAIAFLKTCGGDFAAKDIERLELLETLLTNNRRFYVSLRIPSIAHLKKEEALSKMQQAFEFPISLTRLMRVLLSHNRIEILSDVLRRIRYEYARQNAIETFTVTSSHTLSTARKKDVVDFIRSLTASRVRTRYRLDKSLIAGLRIESTTHLWERSLRKELMGIRTHMTKQGMPW